jgi:hypothetical protein
MASCIRRWTTGVGLVSGVTAAAMIGLAGEPIAHADTPVDVMDQAIADLNQGTVVLDAAPTAELSTRQAGTLADTINLNQQLEPTLTGIGTAQEGLPAGDQTFLADADQQFVSAAQNMLSAEQAFVAADQTGELSGNSFNSADLGLIDGALGLLSADFNVGGDTVLAFFDPDIGSLGAASASAVTAASTPADLLSEGDADLTDAGTVLNGIDLSGQSSDISSIVSNEAEIAGQSITIQDEIGSFQTEIVGDQAQLAGTPGYDLMTAATNDLFTQADQGLLNADDALLNSSQLLATTIDGGSGLTDADVLSGTEAMLQLAGADLSAFGTTFDAAFTPFLDLFGGF